MAIKIITDSTCDFSAAKAEELGVSVVPLKVRFGSREYREGIDITMEQFYTKLEKSPTLPTTSQPSPQDFENRLRPILEQGDEAIVITISSVLSGTYQSADIARRNLKSKHIHLIDSKSATIGLGDLVSKAVELSAGGASASEIVSLINDYANRLHVVAIIDTLKYLHKGGRLSTLSTVLGGVLGIKPIIALANGAVELVGRGRGIKGAAEWIGKHYAGQNIDHSLGTVFGYSGASDCMNQMIPVCQRHGVGDYSLGTVGSVIGTHAGPNAAAIVYYTHE